MSEHPLAVAIAGVHVDIVELDSAESIEEGVFACVRGVLDDSGLEARDIDTVVLSADDVSDGRSITTMLHSTAAGAYFKDEIRVTNGPLTAVGLASLRIAGGLSERAIIAGWWKPRADPNAISASSLDPTARAVGYQATLTSVEQLAAVYGACILAPADSVEGPEVKVFAFGQADYSAWLGGYGEPAGVLERVGRRIAPSMRQLDGRGLVSFSRGWASEAKNVLLHSAEVPSDWDTLPDVDPFCGQADGFVGLARSLARLEAEQAALIAATGLPPFLQVEALLVERAS